MHNGLIAKSMILGIIALCLTASIGSAFSTSPAVRPQQLTSGNTLYVGGNGSGNYTTIQAAINNASNGDTVFVYNGTYAENLDTKLKQISLVGENRDITFLTGPTDASPVLKISTKNVNVSGFTMTGVTNQVILQVMSLAENVRIQNNIIKEGGTGISLGLTTSRITINDNIIQDQGFVAVNIQTSTYDMISFNRIQGSAGQGITFSLSSSHNSIVNNTIIDNAKEAIIFSGSGSTDNTITGNNISGNEVGIRLNSAGSNAIRSNNIQGNLREGILMQLSNENTIVFNNFIGNKRQAAFKLSSRNTWDSNYWSNWIGFRFTGDGFQKMPKMVHGIILFAFDMHPMKVPYNYTGFP
jgi:nitrous oxidase accessory protein